MDEKSLSRAFSESLKEESISCVSNLAEVGLDAILEDGLLKDVPIISTAVSIYKIGSSLLDRHNLRKLIVFLNKINEGIIDDEKRIEYQQQLRDNEKFKNQQIEYLLILINRYTSYEKPIALAKLFLAYLDYIITWEELVNYSETIDLLLSSDIDILKSQDCTGEIYILNRTLGNECYLRFVAAGLLCEKFDKSGMVSDGNGGFAVTWDALQKTQQEEKTYVFTEYGIKMIRLLK